MKRLTVISLMLAFIIFSSVASVAVSQSRKYAQLGIEITTNTCAETLYFPVGLTREKGLVATVPVRDGGNVTAVRIIPVMEGGKIRFDAILLSGNYTESLPRHGLDQLKIVKLLSRVAAAGETRIVSDETNDSLWSVTIRAVPLREPVAAVGHQPQFVKTTAQDGDKGCGCAYCHELRVCPNRGSCIDTTCGSICCPNGESEIGAIPQRPNGGTVATVVQHLVMAYSLL